ncbi:MAG: MlaD family protein [Propionibacteriales bacterium]|nr:MlaD family protein [Propionibacteriales bacterium]
MRKLATYRERLANTPGLGRDVAAVLICVTLGLGCAGYNLAHQQTRLPWQDSFRLVADFDKAPGVRPEAPQEVRIAGVRVGRITAAEVTESGNARLTMEIEPEHRVYANARLVLRSKSPLNVMYVELNPGSPDAPVLDEGAVVPVSQTRRLVQPYEVLDELDERARAALTPLLDQASVALATTDKDLPKGLAATSRTLNVFEPVVTSLVQRREHIARLVSSLAVIVRAVGADGPRLADLTRGMDRTLRALVRRDDELARSLRSLPGFTRDLDGALSDVTDVTTALDPALDDLVAAVPEVEQGVESLTGTVTSARQFVADLSPVVTDAVPVVADLAPFARNAAPALSDLRAVTADLPAATARIVPWLGDLAAFTYQTSSAFSLFDANGGLGRADLILDLTNPTGGLGDDGVDGGSR